MSACAYHELQTAHAVASIAGGAMQRMRLM